MKTKVTFFLLFAAISGLVLLQNSISPTSKKQFAISVPDEPNLKTLIRMESKLHPQNQPNDWLAMQRMYPYNQIKTESYVEAMKAGVALQKQNQEKLNWELAGPTNIGGRITDIEVVAANTDIIYVGAATGGILKTTNGGYDWENVFDDAPVISIGDLAIDPNNSDIIYAGTGEANSSSFSFLGNGMYKSYDAGENWEYLGLENSAYIGRVVVDYSNSQRVFVAACGSLFSDNDQRGIYRSLDGGENWQRVLFLTDSTSGIDIVQHPENPEILYAAMWERIRGLNYRRSFGNSSGIWKSENGGDTWAELTSGLPTGNDVGRIGIDISKSNPNVLYAFYDNQTFVGVYKTTNGGTSWTATNHNSIQGMNSNFGWYFGQIRVDPTDENQIYVMGMEMYKSTNGGNSYIGLAGYWNFDEIHVDHHAMWIDPATGRIFQGNDGGLYISDDDGYAWEKINNLPITQFYAIDIDYLIPERIYGGTQDNNTIRTLTGDIDDWEAILGGDGMYTLVDYTDPTFIYAESQNGNLNRSSNLGYTFNWIGEPAAADRTNWSSPYVLHPTDPSILYFGTYRVWKGTERGYYWEIASPDLTKGDDGTSYHTITTIDISKLNPDMLLTGSDDGLVHITTNAGGSWQNITAGLPDRWITSVKFDPFEQNTIYATVSGFRWDEAQPHVFKSLNLGQTWIDISGNLPDLPVNVFLCDPEFEDRYFIGTDAGLFSTDNGGDYWYGITPGMPNVAVVTMKIHEPTLDLVIGTYGNSCYRINLDGVINRVENTSVSGDFDVNIFPNPVRTQANISIENPDKGQVLVQILDLKGTLISTVFEGQRENGTQNFAWNTGSQSGKSLPNGVYLCKITCGNLVAESKIILMK
jgi:photosystem II stability/assembly factor-like uncharacterized protein